ncbi:hypothetical protein R5R35_011617 [Gryllus longicercus]|uniref:Accessory gland protein n=1 Tax=Gryllus longicercus TaxID=2509291 RepID=A0AAN9Z7Z4_9ORTH
MRQVQMTLLCSLLSVLLISTATSREDDPVQEARLAVKTAPNNFTVDL